MKKLLSIILTFLVFTAVGCGNSMEKKAMDQAKLALANKEYDKASASFQLVLDEDSKNDEARKTKEIIDTYLNAKKSIDSNNIDEANTTISSIDGEYSNYSIKDDVDSLKTDIENKILLKNKIKDDIDKAESLVNEKKYDEAKTIIDGLNKNDLDETEKSKVNELTSTIATELAKINEAKQVQAKKTLTSQEARQLILKEDGNYISSIVNANTRLSNDCKEYSAENMFTGSSWNIPKEPCYEFYLSDYDNNGEIVCDICEYLVGKESKKVYQIPNQGLCPAYEIANNQKVKKYEWIGEK